MSEQAPNPQPQHYEVAQHPAGFFHSNQNNRHLLSTLVQIAPALDDPDNFYAVMGSKLRPAGVALVPGMKAADGSAHQIEVTTHGTEHDEAAKQRLTRAIGGMAAFANQWNDPAAYLNYDFGEPRPDEQDRSSAPTRTGKHYIPYEDFVEDPEDYYTRLGQGEDVEVIMKYAKDLTPEERMKYGLVTDPDPDNVYSAPDYVGTPSDNADEGYGHGGDSD